MRIYIKSIATEGSSTTEEINPTNIKMVKLSEDITSFYSRGSLLINDIGGTYSNRIKVGSELIFLENSPITLKVLSFKKTPATSNALYASRLEIDLISPWYFEKTPRVSAYDGSASTIINSVLKEEKFSITSSIEDTNDRPIRRYRCHSSAQDFIKSVAKKGYKFIKNTSGEEYFPLFAYTTLGGVFTTKSLNTLRQNIAHYKILPFQTLEEQQAYTSSNSSDSDFEIMRAFSYSITYGSKPLPVKNNLERLTAQIYKGNTTTPDSESVEFKGIVNNSQILDSIPDTTNISSWEIFPSDSIATMCESYIQDYYQGMIINAYTQGFCEDKGLLGKVLKADIPSSLGISENKYLVRGLEYSLENTTSTSNALTELKLVPIGNF